jgi:hypothetical protein
LVDQSNPVGEKKCEDGAEKRGAQPVGPHLGVKYGHPNPFPLSVDENAGKDRRGSVDFPPNSL